MALVERIDDCGRLAWIALTVLAFMAFFPLGLAVLAFLFWSGRMGCGMRRRYGEDPGAWIAEKRERFERKMARLQGRGGPWSGGTAAPRAFAPTGNAAFDEYRENTLKRLEEEANSFRDYLHRLRTARDKAEFDQYMAERRGRDGGPDGSASPAGA